MRKFSLFILVFCLSFSFALNVFALTPEDNFYVNDYLGLLSESQKETMIEKANNLYSENGVQIVAVITDKVVGEGISSYANKTFNDWGIGTEGDDNGVLLLLAADDFQVHIEVGTGMEAYISDSRAGSILDEYFNADTTYETMGDAVYGSYMDLIDTGYKAETNAPAPAAEARGNEQAVSSGGFGSFFGSLILVIVTVFLFVAISAIGGGGRAYSRPYRPTIFPGSFWGGYRGMGRRNNPPPPPFGGGGFGGGSFGGGGSSRGGGASRNFGSGGSRPSGSRGFGGGGRSFGGGGSSRGGGASRSFGKK